MAEVSNIYYICLGKFSHTFTEIFFILIWFWSGPRRNETQLTDKLYKLYKYRYNTEICQKETSISGEKYKYIISNRSDSKWGVCYIKNDTYIYLSVIMTMVQNTPRNPHWKCLIKLS